MRPCPEASLRSLMHRAGSGWPLSVPAPLRTGPANSVVLPFCKCDGAKRHGSPHSNSHWVTVKYSVDTAYPPASAKAQYQTPSLPCRSPPSRGSPQPHSSLVPMSLMPLKLGCNFLSGLCALTSASDRCPWEPRTHGVWSILIDRRALWATTPLPRPAPL